MSQLSVMRVALLVGGLAAIGLSVALQSGYATDGGPLSGPGTTAIVAIAGGIAIGLSLVHGRRK